MASINWRTSPTVLNDGTGETFAACIRMLTNSRLVVGAEEQKTRTVNIRNRDDPATQKHGALIPLQDALQKLIQLRDERRLKNEIML